MLGRDVITGSLWAIMLFLFAHFGQDFAVSQRELLTGNDIFAIVVVMTTDIMIIILALHKRNVNNKMKAQQ